MLDGILQWLTQHALLLGSLAAVVTIITGIEILFKPLRWAIRRLWSLLSRSFRTGAKRPHVILDFVAMDFPHSHWGLGNIGNNPTTYIVTKWHITQAPGSGVLASVHKCLRIRDLCKELGIFACARILQRSGSGKPRPTLVWCLCAR
jgi:hypothetical protein